MRRVPPKNGFEGKKTQPQSQYFEQVHAFSGRTFPSIYFKLSISISHPPISASKKLFPGTGLHFLQKANHPCGSEKAMRTMPPPHLPLSWLPSQNPHTPVTSCHAMLAVSTHSSARPFVPLPAHRSASLLCSRKVWVTQSVVRCRERIPRQHHSSRSLGAFSTVPILVFILEWPFIQSTIVLLSPLISSVGSFQATGIPRSSGGRSLGFFVGTGPLDSVFLSTGCFSLRGCVCVVSCIQSFPSPAYLAIGVSHCTPLLWNPTLCFHLWTLYGSHVIPQEDRLLHHAVGLHPKVEGRAIITATSPSYTAHVIVVHILFALFPVSSGRLIFLQQSLTNRDVMIL